jgi:sarcosine oxidase, subunit alpha
VRRLDRGGTWIDRSKVVRFTFDGRGYEGFDGDTLASALLANDVVGGFRSPILGRPRGVFSAGVEEPNAFVEVSEPWFDPIVAATTVQLVDGMVAGSLAGVGRLPARADERGRRRAEHRHLHVELLVVGGGNDGLTEAEAAAAGGERVLLVEQEPRLAGAGTTSRPEGVTTMTSATALGLYDDGFAIVHEHARPVERLWHVRAKRVVLATGGHERPIAFADNDRPGVMLEGAAERYLAGSGVLAGERIVIFTARSPAYAGARSFREGGAEVPAIVDVRPQEPVPGSLPRGTEVLGGWTVRGTEGDGRISAVHVDGPDGERRTIECDALLVSGGWNPNLALWRAIGGRVRWDGASACFVPDGGGPPWLSVVGTAAGGASADAAYWYVPADDYSRHFVDLQRDQTVADIATALENGFRSVEHVKRATYIGTAVDQGRTSGVLAAEIVNQLLGWDAGAQGPTNARPPYTPVSYSVVAGPYRGSLLDPIRTTPIHAWHVEHDAVFENVGQWKRPWYFPHDGEEMEIAVRRECLAVRTGVGVMDASTLGKIEVVGPDAPAFLDRIYTNAMSPLRTGRIRYGLMCGLDGMVMDDGVAMRLADDRYLVTTTTGGATGVLDHFEEWLQTEWPELRVSCTSVTEQWATVAIAGPQARDVLAATGTDIELSADAFPFMTFRDGTVASIPARVARVSFSGELAYEVNVEAWHGLALWEVVMQAGRAFGITPYGTEAMHVLRAEKGFPIVGQDTDGTVTPHDLGMSWIVNEEKGDFVGRRSLRRVDLARPDRKQLVGLLPKDPDAGLPEGAQLVIRDTGDVPVPMVGHVTSSYTSPVLGHAFALALVSRGRELHGTTLYAPLPTATIAAEVASPVFYDPEGARRDG